MSRGAAGRSVLLIWLVVGCAPATATRVDIHPPIRENDLLRSRRVLIAGFLAGRTEELDPNHETARFLRTQLRSTAAVTVIETEPLDLVGLSQSASTRNRSGDPARAVFENAVFWRKLGEEYSQPLIVTGAVAFAPVAPRAEQRNVGRGTMRFWHRGASLQLQLVFISGETGEIIDSAATAPRVAYATTGRESMLSLYFKLMRLSMPAVVEALGQQATASRVLLR